MILGRVLYAFVCLSMLLGLYPSVCHQCSKKWIFEGRLLRHGFQKCASRCSEEHVFAHGRKKCIMIKLWRQLSDKSVQMSRSQMRMRMRMRRMVIAKMMMIWKMMMRMRKIMIMIRMMCSWSVKSEFLRLRGPIMQMLYHLPVHWISLTSM